MIGFLLATVQLYFGWEEIRPLKDTPDGCPRWNPPIPNKPFHTHNPSDDMVLSIVLDINEWWATQDPCDTPPIVMWWRAIGILLVVTISTLLFRCIFDIDSKPDKQ
jgi:hypothetical protein